MKKVPLGVKPQSNRPPTADEWVSAAAPQSAGNSASTSNGVESAMPEAQAPETTPMKRLTIDVPESLHAQIKSACALKGVKMADEIRALLETHFLTTQNH